MKRIILLLYIVGLLISSDSLFAQLTLRNGEQKLEDKYVFFSKGIKCKVIPKVKYYAEKYDQLEISFEAEWYDKKNERIDDKKNAVYLIENYDKFIDYHEKEGISIQYDPSVDIRNEPTTITILQNSKKVPIEPFKSGFMGFAVSSQGSVKVTSLNPANGEVEVQFKFFHVIKGNTRYFKSFAKDALSWTFILPEKSVKRKDCSQIEKEYAKKMRIVDEGNQLAYFKTKLNEKKADIKKVENDFNSFKDRIKTAENLLLKIENSADFEDCDDLKASFVNTLNAFLSENSNYGSIEEKIEELKNKPVVKKEVKKTTKPKESKQKPSQSKDIDWSSLENKYENILSGQTRSFTYLQERIHNITVDINTSIKENSVQLNQFVGIENSKDQLSSDSLEMIEELLSIIGEVSSENNDRIGSLQKELLSFSSEVDKDLNRCQSEFIKLDKDKGSKKSWNYRKGLQDILDNIESEENYLDDIQNLISENYSKYYSMLKDLDPDRSIDIQKITEILEERFVSRYNEILDLSNDYDQIKIDFEDKRYSNWFFKATKNKLISRTDRLGESLAVLIVDMDSLKSYKDEQSLENNIEFFIDEEHEFEKVSISLEPAIEYLKADIEEWPYDPFPYFYLILVVVVVLILVFGGRVYFNAMKKERKAKLAKASPNKPSGGVVLMQSQTDNSIKGKGLQPVRKLAGVDFIEIDMSEEWDDSMVGKVYFHRDCIKKTYRFFEDSIKAVGEETTANETGGYLIGRWDFNKDNATKFDISLEDFIEPGDDATFSRYQLNFGAKIGVKLQKTLENCRQKENQDFVLISWFHSHPGLKIFLSDYDLTVQEDFSPKDHRMRMIALVLDPYTPEWDLGIFTYKSSGEMNNSKDSKKLYSLEDMYQWALDPHKAKGPDNYFSAHIYKLYSNTLVNNVYFSNSCILDIKRHIEDNSNPSSNESIFLGGYKLNNQSLSYDVSFENVNVLNLVEDEIISKYESLGYLLTTHEEVPDLPNILSNPVLAEKEIPLVLIYNYVSKTLCILSRTKEITFNNPPPQGGKIKFNDMVNWTRKRK